MNPGGPIPNGFLPVEKQNAQKRRFKVKNAGDLSIREFSDEVRNILSGQDSVFVLFEDRKVRMMSFGDHVHMMSSWSLAKAVEHLGVISSAEDLFDQIERTGRRPPRDPFEQKAESDLVAIDPRAAAEARIDLHNAEKRKEFLDEFAVIDSTRVHEISGNTGSNPSQTAAVWRKANRILGLPVGQRTVYLAFQFDEGGRPYPLMKRVLDALPDDMTPWQTAFWLVSPSSALDGGPPLNAIRRGDEKVVDAARNEASEVIG